MNESEIDPLIRPVEHRGRTFWIAVFALLVVVALGAFAYATQVRHGLDVTGLSRPVYWGTYILWLIFFLGISYGALLFSAVLRLTGSELGRPVARAAEAIALCALLVGGPQPLIDLGRVDRAAWILLHPNLSSPMLWDILSISVYSAVLLLYLWVTLIPDAALLRDRGMGGTLRRAVYRALAAGFSGTESQMRRWRRAVGALAAIAIPVAIAARTLLAWVPGLSQRPMWHSPLIGPTFLLGAVFSGIATLVVVLGVLRRAFGLERFLRRDHFARLGLCLCVAACAWAYFTLAEHVTAAYGQRPDDLAVLRERLTGGQAPVFWTMIAFLSSPLLLSLRRLRTIPVTIAISSLVVMGAWLERWIILVPSQLVSLLPHAPASYRPTWVEWSELAGTLAAFVLLLALFSHLFPAVPIADAPEAPPDERNPRRTQVT